MRAEHHLIKVDVSSLNLASRSILEPLIYCQGLCCFYNLSDLITLKPLITLVGYNSHIPMSTQLSLKDVNFLKYLKEFRI